MLVSSVFFNRTARQILEERGANKGVSRVTRIRPGRPAQRVVRAPRGDPVARAVRRHL